MLATVPVTMARYIVVFALFVVTCSAVTLEFSDVTQPLSWREAFLSGRCRHQNDVIDDVSPDGVQIDTTYNITEAWIGMYTTSSQFITLEACYFYYDGIDISIETLPRYDFLNDSDPIASCYRFCNASRFGLTNDTCICVPENTKPTIVPILTLPHICPSDFGAICGTGTIISIPDMRPGRFICTYNIMNGTADNYGAGDCLMYNTTGEVSTATDCTQNKSYICVENKRNTILQNIVSNNFPTSWWFAAIRCFNNRTFFGNLASVIRYVDSGGAMDSYWISAFRRPYFSFKSPGEIHLNRCVAVRNNSGIFTLFVKDCNALLPALCSFVSPEATTRMLSTSTSGNDTVGQTHISVATLPVLWPLVFVALGIIVMVIVVVICHRKRSTRKRSSSDHPNKVNGQRNLKEMNTHKKPAFNESRNVLTRERNTNSSNTRPEESEYENPSFSSQDQINKSRYTSVVDDIYNELHAGAKSETNDDIYDHTKTTQPDDNMYDTSRRSGSLGNNTTAELLEYDTMANVNARTTGNSDIYDSHQSGKKPEVISESDYDSMANINSRVEGIYGANGDMTSQSNYDVSGMYDHV